ncbi:MAG: radical SAM protein [Candidatus Omnitrophica bacterium]|nr:radical SAM protein [Candidatus Omnitrophota bacterium]
MKQNNYLEIKKINIMPRLPLEGSIDLTYRCNNNCRHCWLCIPADSEEKKKEMSFREIGKIVGEAKKMGCRQWSISGGEPMLRPDFCEIFDHITSNSRGYSLNTNGTMISPKIARLMKRAGIKMVAIYGATAEVHDHITRNPGSFDATIRGFSYLKEAGANFIVQIIPMRDNYHQLEKMVGLAQSLSKHYRIGAAWLYLSACGDAERNKEISRQRLDAKDVVEVDKPDLSYEEWSDKSYGGNCLKKGKAGHFFSECISARRNFHIDPYGGMSFCCFIKDPVFRYDLRDGDFKECWEKFIPSLSRQIEATAEYEEHCAFCESRKDCRWCPSYAYLEHGRFGAKIDYLCEVARENKKFKEEWQAKHRRYFRIAGMTMQLDSDIAFNDNTFHPKFKMFETNAPGEDMIHIKHHFSLPDLDGKELGVEVYRKAPWAIYKKGDSWIYIGISPSGGDKNIHRVAVFNREHTRAKIYNDKNENFENGGLHSLTLFSSDQVLLARILADREGCYIHSCGVDFDGKGFLFVGHSEAGKSTMARLLKNKAKILCDDRMIVRRHTGGFKIYGTWSHGDVPDVSADSAPLNAIFFLEKSKENRIIPVENKKEITKRLLACLIKPFVTVDWWEKSLGLLERIAGEVPCYVLRFDKSGDVVKLLEDI